MVIRLDRLSESERRSVVERYAEGFDTKEIRDQLVADRLFVRRPAMINEAQIYNALTKVESMAKQFLSVSARKSARERAEAHFKEQPAAVAASAPSKKTKAAGKPAAPVKKAPRVLPDLTAGAIGPRDYQHHYTQAVVLKSKVSEANGTYRAALKKAKEAGIADNVITAAMAWAKKDPETLTSFFLQLAEVFRIAQVKVQLDMFQGVGAISRPAHIFEEGYQAGVAAKSTGDCPHDANVQAGQIWLYGYSIGQAENASKIGQTPAADEPSATAH